MSLLIFDIDGTLTDTKEVDDSSFISAFQDEFNIILGECDWTIFENITDTGLFEDLYKSTFNKYPDEIEKVNFQQRFFKYLERSLADTPEKFSAVEGASDFINYLMGNNTFIAFGTGGWKYSAKLKLQSANIAHYNIPLSSCDDHKRRQDILLKAIRMSCEHYCKTNFDSIIYFGDGEWDYKTTSDLQIPFIGIDYSKNGKLEKLGVKNILYNFSDKEKIEQLINLSR